MAFGHPVFCSVFSYILCLWFAVLVPAAYSTSTVLPGVNDGLAEKGGPEKKGCLLVRVEPNLAVAINPTISTVL